MDDTLAHIPARLLQKTDGKTPLLHQLTTFTYKIGKRSSISIPARTNIAENARKTAQPGLLPARIVNSMIFQWCKQ